MMRLKIPFLLLICLFSFSALAASPSSVLVNVAPENPEPKENVTISLQSYANNLDSVSISWRVDGKVLVSGIGLKSFSVLAPAAGAETRVSALVALPEGDIEKIIVIRPTVMALLWQANDSYVPPFYRGKALPSIGSEIKIVAIPEAKSGSASGGFINPRDMVYAWKKDYNNDQSASGYGKDFYLLTNDYLEDANNISVVASTTDQRYSSAGDLAVRIFDPKIIFYKVDSALGTLWERALENGHLVEKEEIIEAAPYFISPSDIRIPSLNWIWSINNSFVEASVVTPNILPVRAEEGLSGKAKIKLEVSNKYKLLTEVEKEIEVEF